MNKNKNITLIYNKLPNGGPLSLLYVGSALKRNGYNVKIVSGTSETLLSSIPELVKEKPLFFGFSTFTGIPIKGCISLSRYIKKLDPASRIIWGGVHPSLLPRECLSEDYIDYVCIGEGEETAVEFADHLYAGADDFSGVKGMGYKKDNQIFITEPRPAQMEIDKFEIDWDLVDLNEFVLTNDPYGQRIYNYSTSRGCPFNCGFCYNLAFNKIRKVRSHSIERVVSDLKYIKSKIGVNRIRFCDDNFFANPSRAIEILYKIKEFGVYPLDLQVRVDSLTEDLCRKLSGIGITRFIIGWESGNNRILSLIKKGITIEQTMKKMDLLSKFENIIIRASSFIGVPTETLEEASDTIERAIQISEKLPSAAPEVGNYIPYPGSDLYQLAIQEGFVPPKNTEEWSNFNIRDPRKINFPWIKWNIPDKSAFLYGVIIYTQSLYHAKSANWFKTLAKQIIYQIVKFRLRHKFFKFPFELVLAHRFGSKTTALP